MMETISKRLQDSLAELDESIAQSISTPPRKDRFYISQKGLSPSIKLTDVTVPLTSHAFLSEHTLDVTSVAILAQDDPGLYSAQSLFSEFVDILIKHPSECQIWEEVSKYEAACSQKVDCLSHLIKKVPQQHPTFLRTRGICDQLIAERDTWRLLGSLYSERFRDEAEEDMIKDEIIGFASDQMIIEHLYDTNTVVKEAQLIVDWLERNASDDVLGKYAGNVEFCCDAHIAWENTLQVMKSHKLSRNMRLCETRPLVTSLDPDAPLREGHLLHDLDEEDESRLLRSMFKHIRSGEVAEAEELCIRSGQHWRAATLEGWKLHHDCNIFDPTCRKPVVGNPYRDVWKSVAWHMASDLRLPAYERACYGALCGHLKSMLEVCSVWQDVLWAYTRTLVDQRVEEQLRFLSSHLRSLHQLPKEYPEEKFTMTSVFEALEKQSDLEQDNSYYVLQKYLILDDIKSLVENICGWTKKENISSHLLRCATHILVVLKKIGRIPPEMGDSFTNVVHACVKDAVERGDVEQVAWYTSILPPWLRVKSYSNFLINITDDHHRRCALELASKAGLDTCAITAAVVSSVRLSSCIETQTGDLAAETTSEDKLKISVIDWLLYNPCQREEALIQGNAIVRSFLISRKINAAKSLIEKIPSDYVSVIVKQQVHNFGSSDLPQPTENAIREFLCYCTFLEAQEAFSDWFSHYHQKKPHEPKKPKPGCDFAEQIAYDHTLHQFKRDLEAWTYTLSLFTKTASERLYNVLLFPDGGWLVESSFEAKSKEDKSSVQSESDRPHQLMVLRSIYIPQVTFLLQNILHLTEKYKECIQLADLIASEQYQLYKAFGVNELERFLIKLQDTSKVLLDTNCDSLGYPLQ